MRNCLLPLLAIVLLLVRGVDAVANDSIARVGAGGITLVKNDHIRMVKEVLEISTATIRVHYRFLNETSQDIRATVAFPMPPYRWNPGISMTDENIRPLASFSIWVDGRKVPTQQNRVALIRGVDATEKLRKIGLSESQIFETFGDCQDDNGTYKCGLSEAQYAEIDRIGGGYNDWKVAETAYWEQVFPAKKEIEIIHEYKPFVGMSYGIPYQSGYGYVGSLIPNASLEKDLTEVCLDERTQRSISKRIDSLVAKGEANVWVGLKDVEYVLGTGRNWKGPIKDFKLVIKKDAPDQIVTLCFPGKPKRTSSTTIEFTHHNFVPQDKLIVYFYSIAGELKR